MNPIRVYITPGGWWHWRCRLDHTPMQGLALLLCASWYTTPGPAADAGRRHLALCHGRKSHE